MRDNSNFLVRSCGLALAAAFALSTVAHADGLVVETSSAEYSYGDIIKTGDMVTVAEGETLAVLDQSGELVIIDQTQKYSSGRSVPPRKTVSLLDAVTGSGHRADIGGTRTDDFDTCLAEAEKRDDLNADDCTRAFPEATGAPTLDVRLAMRTASLKPGDPLMFKLEANFDAVVTCTASATDGTAPPNPLDLAGTPGLHLMENVMAMAPLRGSPRLFAPAETGSYTVTCRAIDAHTWTDFTSATRAPSIDADLLDQYVELRSVPTATASTEIMVAE